MIMFTRHSVAVTGILRLAMLITPAYAAEPQIGVQPSVKSVTCEFSLGVTGTWSGGEPHAAIKADRLTLRYDSIDTDGGTARIVGNGNAGPSDIVVKLTLGTLHFVQSFIDGPLYVTTVFPTEARLGRLKAVHTRHEFTEVSLPGFTSRPEQYYGDCSVEQ
jgi:hypothetical protein